MDAATNILIITCGFAPAFRPSAIMAVQLANYLSEQGVQVTVLTLEEEDLLAVAPYDSDIARAVSPSVRVVRVSGGPIRRRLRNAQNAQDMVTKHKHNPLRNLLIPDPYVDCIYPMLRQAERLVRQSSPSLVFSFAYPWSSHIVARLLSANTNIKWVAFYGDPWTGNFASDLKLATWRRQLNRLIENRILHAADKVIVTTEKTRKLYEQEFPHLVGKVSVARAGYQAAIPLAVSRLSKSNSTVRSALDKRRWLVHAGRIYRGARSAEPLLRGIKRLQHSYPQLNEELVVWLIGKVDDETMQQIEQCHLKDVVQVLPWVEQAELMSWLTAADTLLLLGNNKGVQVPSKLYEYLALRKPILVLQEAVDDEAAQIVGRVDAGWTINNEDKEIEAFLRQLLDNRIAYPRFNGTSEVQEFSLLTSLESCWQAIQETI